MIVTCRRFVEIITDEREGALPRWEQRHFHEHRDACGSCRRYLEGFDRTVALLRDVPQEPAPGALRAELLDRFRAGRGGQQR